MNSENHLKTLYQKAADYILHAGFQMLKEIGERMPNGYFVYTSNVDGQFQKAGFSEEKIIE